MTALNKTKKNKKGCPVFQEKIEGRHPQLPSRVSPTLVTPLLANKAKLEMAFTTNVCAFRDLTMKKNAYLQMSTYTVAQLEITVTNETVLY